MFKLQSRYVFWTHLLLCVVGISVSVFALYVEKTKERDADYRAVCDISETVSCSAVFASRYGKGFGLIDYFVDKDHWFNQPNSVFGILFYLIQIALALSRSSQLALYLVFLSVAANVGSAYLAYILVYVLQDVCIVCVTVYVINFLVLICNIAMWQHLVNSCRANSGKAQNDNKLKSS